MGRCGNAWLAYGRGEDNIYERMTRDARTRRERRDKNGRIEKAEIRNVRLRLMREEKRISFVSNIRDT